MTVGGLVGGANIIDQLIGNTNPQTTIAKVNGEIISPSQFNSLVNQQLTSVKSNGQSVNDFQINQACLIDLKIINTLAITFYTC